MNKIAAILVLCLIFSDSALAWGEGFSAITKNVENIDRANYQSGTHESSYQQSVLGGGWFGYNYAGSTPWGGRYFFSSRWRLW